MSKVHYPSDNPAVPTPAPDHTRWIAEAMGRPDFVAPRGLLDLLNYQMHLVISFSTAGVTRMCEREFGITRHEWGYIGLLATFGALAPSELALRSGMDRSRTSKALVPLMTKGLIERRPVAGDGRRAQVALTAAGQRLYDAILPRVLKIHRELLAPFDAAEVELLATVLDRLRRRAIELETRAQKKPARGR